VLLGFIEFGCAKSDPHRSEAQTILAASADADVTSSPSNLELRAIVRELGDPDTEHRKEAHKRLEALQKAGVSTSDGLFLLQAAKDKYPPEASGLSSTQMTLIQAASKHPDASYVPRVREIFSSLDPDAQTEALTLLAAINDKAAAYALLDVLEAAIASGSPPELRLAKLEKTLRFPAVYFPRILNSAKGPAVWGVFSLCLAYAKAGAISPEMLAKHALPLVEAYRPIHDKILPAQMHAGLSWVWEDEYESVREDAALMLDVMAYFPAAEIEAVLTDATRLRDPRLAGFAATSLLRIGRDVDASVLRRVAESSEARSWLFDELKRLGKRQLFPSEWATQPALAEAEMVRWLVYPTELGRAPDQIELMKVVSDDYGPPDGVLEWYLFRFRTKPPHWSAKDGWMAGVAGPFRKADAPSTVAYGDTFSKFTRWGSLTPEQHVAEVRELMTDWRQRKGQRSSE
jgi:hypothetical protein